MSAQTSTSPSVMPSQIEQVANGVWRIRMGTPEKWVPTRLRSAPPQERSLALLPECHLPFDLDSIVGTTSTRGCTVRLPLGGGERIYGFGLNSRLFEMTTGKDGKKHSGRHVFLRPTDNPENDLGDSHAPVPFYLSQAGYGVYVDTARYASFYTGTAVSVRARQPAAENRGVSLSTDELYAIKEQEEKTMFVDVPTAAGVDVYIFGGPDMQHAVQRYNLFSGGGPVPPLWGLGIAYRGFGKFSAEDTLKLAKSFREAHIPCDVWGLEPGWQSHAYSCSFVWNESIM